MPPSIVPIRSSRWRDPDGATRVSEPSSTSSRIMRPTRIYPVSSAVELSRRRRLAAAADRSQRTQLPAGASGTAGSEGHSSSPDVVRPALLPQARPRPAGCAEHRPEPLLQGRLRGLPQRIDSRAVAARSTLRGCGNGGRRSSFPPRRTTCRFCSKRVRRYNTSCACTMLLFVGK